MPLDRRSFVAALAATMAETLDAQSTPVPIIDAHIHLYDPTRPQGVPYPNKDNPVVYVPTLPERYRKVVESQGIVGAIEIEASPWIEDNLWVLEVCEKEPIMVGTIGDLEPAKPGFGEFLERYHRNPLFLGIRVGNLWGRNLKADSAQPEFIPGLKLLAGAGLTLETTNPQPDVLGVLLMISDRIPDLRIVIGHTGGLTLPTDPASRQTVESNLRELAKRPHVFAKVSMVARRANNKVDMDPNTYKARFDLLWDIFGEDRLVFGSDWPNSTGNWVSFTDVMKIIQDYFGRKDRAAREKFFWKNSLAAYRWVKRASNQPTA
jgi:L-fuconolactonase